MTQMSPSNFEKLEYRVVPSEYGGWIAQVKDGGMRSNSEGWSWIDGPWSDGNGSRYRWQFFAERCCKRHANLRLTRFLERQRPIKYLGKLP